MQLSILKCHGSSNDFILIDETLETNSAITDEKRSDLTQAICRRDSGIGADGVLFYQPSKIADCKMRMFNPDGSEAEMCGNGLRCIGRYCSEQLNQREVSVETMKSVLSVKRGKQIYAGVETFEAEIGPVSKRSDSLPMLVKTDFFKNEIIEELSPTLKFTALSVPNPHIIAVVDNISESQLETSGIRANSSSLFPHGVNVSFVKVLGKNRIFVTTYERGVGITYSCGTAMSASAYVSVLYGLSETGNSVSVYNKGGMVKCDLSGKSDGNIILKGNATFVFEAEIELEKNCRSITKQLKRKVMSAETDAYDALQNYVKSSLKK